jgi:predicted nucleotidyltransferase
MDSGSGEAGSLAVTGSLKRLSKETGVDFPRIFEARRRTEEALEDRRRKLATLRADDDVAVVLMGSWGRGELTSGSDDDFMLLIDGESRESVHPTIDEIWEALGAEGRPPGREEVFGVPVFSHDLCNKIGLEEDGNKNLTRRMLLVLESVAALGEDNCRDVKAAVLGKYLDKSVKAYRPPRFFLNDVIRYWRTIAVDFEAKHRSRDGEKWGLRNAKLRTSRTLLFASGLLPLLECHLFGEEAIPDYLTQSFDALPTDRVAEAFLLHERMDAGARVFTAYDEFLALIDDEEQRAALEALATEDQGSSEVFASAKRLGKETRSGLLSLLFDTPALYPLTREFAIF